MKRFFFLAVAATALLAACNKTEIVPTSDPQEISFVAVNKVATKTPVSGVDFLDSDKMQVAAYIVAGSEEAGDFLAHLQSSVFKLSKDLIDSIHEEGIVAYTS